MKVKFNSPDEYLEEMGKDGPPSKIVRLTRSYRHGGQLPITHVSVMSTFVNARGECVELTRHCGEDWGRGHDNAKTDAAAQATIDQITKACEAAGYEVRAGRFDDQ